MNDKLKTKILLIGIVVLVCVIGALLYVISTANKPQTPQKISDVGLSAVCPVHSLKCSWQAIPGATGYDVVFIDKQTGQQIEADNKNIDPQNPNAPLEVIAESTPIAGKVYICKVTARNIAGCNPGPQGAGEGTCALPNQPTPTTPPVPTPTTPPNVPTPTTPKTPTPTTPPNVPTPTNTPIPTATPKPTATPTPIPTATPKPTATPTPTNTPIPTATNTPIPTATPVPPLVVTNPPPIVNNPPQVINNPPQVINNPVVVVTNAPQPTPVATGSIGNTIIIAGTVIFTVIGGALLFFL